MMESERLLELGLLAFERLYLEDTLCCMRTGWRV